MSGRLTRADWIRAALDTLSTAGLDAVRVDVLARQLGATRGSFYWHFADRRALIVAALEEWERHCTHDLFDRAGQIDDPRAQIVYLVEDAMDDYIAGLEPAIAAHAADPDVHRIAGRVTRRRIQGASELFVALGSSEAHAERAGTTLLALLLGWAHLRRIAPELLPLPPTSGPDRTAIIGELIDRLTGAS